MDKELELLSSADSVSEVWSTEGLTGDRRCSGRGPLWRDIGSHMAEGGRMGPSWFTAGAVDPVDLQNDVPFCLPKQRGCFQVVILEVGSLFTVISLRDRVLNTQTIYADSK